MIAGMFGSGGRIALWVDENGWVVNGAWQVQYNADLDAVRYSDDQAWALRICNVDPAIMAHGGDYNDVMRRHQCSVDVCAPDYADAWTRAKKQSPG